MDINKILITGATGLLGPALINSFSSYELYGIYWDYPLKTSKCKLFHHDISEDSVLKLIPQIKPDVIIHAAALTDVDLCEKDNALADKVNIVGTRNIVKGAEIANAKVVYVSTDFVFDGEKGNYTEEDTPNPINYYGRSKYLGEKAVIDSNVHYLIARTSLYGWNVQNKISFAEWVINKLGNNEKIDLFSDQFNSMISTHDFSDILSVTVEKNLKGTLNIASKERISKYDFGMAVASVFGLNNTLIQKSDFVVDITKAKRPMDVSLNVDKLESLGIKVPNTKESLERMKKIEKAYKKDFIS